MTDRLIYDYFPSRLNDSELGYCETVRGMPSMLLLGAATHSSSPGTWPVLHVSAAAVLCSGIGLSNNTGRGSSYGTGKTSRRTACTLWPSF